MSANYGYVPPSPYGSVPARQNWVMRNKGLAAVIAVAALFGAVVAAYLASRSPGPSSFLASNSAQVEFIQWQPAASGGIQGTIASDQVSGTAPDETVSVQSVQFTGTVNGSSVTMNIDGGFLVGIRTLNATLNGGTLSLSFVGSSGSIQTSTFVQSGISAYNLAVAALHKQVSHANVLAAQEQARAQQQQQDNQDLQTAQQDLATVQGVSFASDLNALAGDVKQTNSDLAGEQKDAAAGPNADGGGCYNLQQNVEYDAQQNVDYDLQQNVGYDLQQNLLADIRSARQDVATLEGDLQALSGDGVAAPAGVAAAISSVDSAIRQAKATANADIDQANADDVQAYSIADNMATGSCAGDGIGKPAALLSHIH